MRGERIRNGLDLWRAQTGDEWPLSVGSKAMVHGNVAEAVRKLVCRFVPTTQKACDCWVCMKAATLAGKEETRTGDAFCGASPWRC